MTAPNSGCANSDHFYAGGWLLSLLVHGLLVSGALWMTTSLHLPREREVFRWDVAFVQPAVSARSAAHATPSAAQPVRATAPAARPTPANPTPAASVPPPPSPPVLTEARPVPTPPAQLERVPSPPLPQPVQPTAKPQEAAVQDKPPLRESPRPAAHEKSEPSSQMDHQVLPPPLPPVPAQDQAAVASATPTPHQAQAASSNVDSQSAAKQAPAPPTPDHRQHVQTAPTPQHSAPASPPATASEPAASTAQAQASTQVAALPPAPAPSAPQAGSDKAKKSDYGWLAKELWSRVQEVNQYPLAARMNRWEGRVVVKAVVREDGDLREAQVVQSSGYEELDHAALDAIRKIFPIKLSQPLGRAEVVLKVPITYGLK